MPRSPKRKQASGNLVWLDLEMTGLDVETDVIIQSAIIITNADLDVLEEQVWDIWQPEPHLAGMKPFVQDMHAKTGLTERVRASKIDIDRAAGDMLEMIAGWCPYPAVLCGNTIWQDRKFVDRYMPGLSGYLGYRMVDVSSLKILARAWYGPEAVFAKSKEGAHDALVDIRNSIAELAEYRAKLFRKTSA